MPIPRPNRATTGSSSSSPPTTSATTNPRSTAPCGLPAGRCTFSFRRLTATAATAAARYQIVQWDAASAMGRVLKWTGQNGSTWDTSTFNFTDLGTPDAFDSFDHVTFDDSTQTTVNFAGNVEAGKVVVDSPGSYAFSGPGALTSGSLSVVGGGVAGTGDLRQHLRGPDARLQRHAQDHWQRQSL